MNVPAKASSASAKPFLLIAWTAVAFAICSGAGSAQQPQAPATPQPPAATTPVVVANNTDDQDAAILAHQLAALSDEASSSTGASSSTDDNPAGVVPTRPGFNASLATINQHDSSDGWQSILTPNVAYRFNRYVSTNVTVPVYAYINIYDVLSSKAATRTTAASETYGFKTKKFLLGDTDLEVDLETHPSWLDYDLTATLGLPTGDDADGLGAGQVTYAFNNHLEHSVTDWLTPELELGIGDSSNLNDLRARRDFVDVGLNAHFQFGFELDLPHDIAFTTSAYEDLPLATQTVTTTTSNGKKGRQLRTVTTSSQQSIGEDNGFLNTLDIPLSRRITLSGIYNRSLRDKTDTAGFSLTFTLRKRPRSENEVR